MVIDGRQLPSAAKMIAGKDRKLTKRMVAVIRMSPPFLNRSITQAVVTTFTRSFCGRRALRVASEERIGGRTFHTPANVVIFCLLFRVATSADSQLYAQSN